MVAVGHGVEAIIYGRTAVTYQLEFVQPGVILSHKERDGMRAGRQVELLGCTVLLAKALGIKAGVLKRVPGGSLRAVHADVEGIAGGIIGVDPAPDAIQPGGRHVELELGPMIGYGTIIEASRTLRGKNVLTAAGAGVAINDEIAIQRSLFGLLHKATVRVGLDDIVGKDVVHSVLATESLQRCGRDPGADTLDDAQVLLHLSTAPPRQGRHRVDVLATDDHVHHAIFVGHESADQLPWAAPWDRGLGSPAAALGERQRRPRRGQEQAQKDQGGDESLGQYLQSEPFRLSVHSVPR